MNLFSFHKDNLDEVVFEHRNKEYGAYAMRKSYDSNLLKASASSFGVLVLFVSTFYVLSLFRKQIAPIVVDPIHVVEIDNAFRKIEIILDPPDNVAAATRNVNPMTYEIVKDHLVNANPDVPHNPDLPNNPVGVENGTPGGAATTIPGGTIIETVPSDPAVAEPEFATIVEEMPSFVGGQEAMIRYLADHIQYPPQARENGIEGKIVVSFVVQKDGSITMLQLVKGIGFGCDDEALRVIAAMPKWNVGRQNGQLRAVKLVLPIYFKLQ
jgi:protein TonB